MHQTALTPLFLLSATCSEEKNMEKRKKKKEKKNKKKINYIHLTTSFCFYAQNRLMWSAFLVPPHECVYFAGWLSNGPSQPPSP